MLIYDMVMSQSHRNRAETNDEAFQERRLLRERGAPVVVDFDLFNFQGLLHTQGHV